MARLKGLPERTVIWRHAVPNAIVPAIQVAALQLAWMAGGVVVVEFVFSYPGIGACAGRRRRQPRHAGGADGDDARGGGLRGDEPARRHRDDPRHAEAADGGAMSDQTIDTAVDRGHRRRRRASPSGHAVLQRRPWLGHPAQRAPARAHEDRRRDRRAADASGRRVRAARGAALADGVRRRAEQRAVGRRDVRRRRARPRRVQPLPARRPDRALDGGRGDPARRGAPASSSGSSPPTRATGSTTC